MNSNGLPIKNSFTSKININNNNIEGVKDIIIKDVPITTTIEEFKTQDDNILLRLQILENFKTLNELQINTIQLNILNLQNENIKLKQIIYNLTNIIY
jgi:hypothetical protein